MAKKLAALVVAAFAAAVLGGPWGTDASPGMTTRVSVASDGAEGNDLSYNSAMSADGRYVAFVSQASNLHPSDTDHTRDVFVRDRETNTVELISRASGADGLKGNDRSDFPDISGDGRFVTFESWARDLEPGAYGGVYVRDRQTNVTTLISRATGAEGAVANKQSGEASISADGRFVAFFSYATNLDASDSDFFTDVYVRDMLTQTTTLVSRANGVNGGKGNFHSGLPSINANGQFVAFSSAADNLHPSDADLIYDVFVRDLTNNETFLVSRASGASGVKANGDSGGPANGISADGRFITFTSVASNLDPDDSDTSRDVFMRDRRAEITYLVSRATGASSAKGNAWSFAQDISGDGRYVAFYSYSTNLDPDDLDGLGDVYVRDSLTHATALRSRSSSAMKGNGESWGGAFAGDGNLLSFNSDADNLVAGDTNAVSDVFVHDICAGGSATDCDGDSLPDLTESFCGADPLSAASMPERVDRAGDDDGDGLANEALPAGAEAYDCDGDGYVGSAEGNVTTSDQDLCGVSGWPSDIVSTEASANRLDLQDLGSFVAPVRRLGTSLGHPRFDARWDLVPGSVVGPAINVQDIAALLSGASGNPPMFGGQRAFGRLCPYQP